MLPPGGEPSGASARNDNGAAFAAFREHRFLWRRIEKRRPHGRRPLHQGKPPIGKLFRAFTVRAGPSRLTVNPSFLRAGRSACATWKNSPPWIVAYPPGRALPARPARSFVSDLRPQRTIAKPIRRAKRILCL